jgi:hypothetical protein
MKFLLPLIVSRRQSPKIGQFDLKNVVIITVKRSLMKSKISWYCPFKRYNLKVHKIENFFGFDFEICTFS